MMLVVVGCAAKRAGETPAPQALFNGKNLEGWYTYLREDKYADPDGVFSVRDGMLRISGQKYGYIGTRQSFKDYRLRVEFKWGERNWPPRLGMARDSGIFLHATGPDGNSYDAAGAFRAAIECNIMEGAVGDILLINGKDQKGARLPVRASAEVADKRDAEGWYWHQPAGKTATLDRGGRINWIGKDARWVDRFVFRGENDIEKPAGEWNVVEIVAEGDRIEVSVNGRIVNRVQNVWPNQGPILLQSEGSEIFIRRVDLWYIKGQPDKGDQ